MVSMSEVLIKFIMEFELERVMGIMLCAITGRIRVVFKVGY